MYESPPFLISALLSNPDVDKIVAGIGFSIIDFTNKKSFISDTWKKFGYSNEVFMAHFPREKVYPGDMQSLESLIKKLRSGESDSGQGEFRFVAENGRTFWLSIDFFVLARDAVGKVSILAFHDTDISKLIAAQEEIRERLVEIESLKDLLTAINKSLDFNETISKIIEHLHRIIPFDRATVQALESNYLSVIGSYGYVETATQTLRFPISGIDNPSARAIASRRPIICNDVEHDFEGFIQVEDAIRVKSWLGIPLVYEGKSMGLLALDSAALGFYTDQHVRIASTVAEHIAMAIEHAKQHTIIKEEARTDKLTGAANRYGLETMGQEIFSRAGKDDQLLGILMLDIDHFKIVNDTYGHSFGDQVLRSLSSGISQCLRCKDYLVRYGGEEFVVLLPGTTTREALVVAERLREKIPLMDVDDNHTCPTVSIGVFSGVPGPQDILHEFIHRADLALYEAKEAGRNRCRVWSPKPEYFDRKN
ncbi:MAG TPA: diguanylate cyclase [Rectinemataceae bacterium]|nr:diguanylate cyclase [Rectinemataceae bacterium]